MQENKKTEDKAAGKREKPVRTREQVLRRRILILALVIAVPLLLFAACQALFVEPELPAHTPAPAPSGDDIEGYIPPATDPKVSGDRKSSHFYTFLVAGLGTGDGGNTDVLMLVSYDVTNQSLNVMNIPRDTMVNVAWDTKKINSVYNGYGGGADGRAALMEKIADLVGFQPDYYVGVEWEAVGKLAEAVDGVEFEVPFDMHYDDPVQDLHIHVNKGLQRLDGEGVMGVLRFRKNNDGSGYREGDIGRIKTQQALLQAVIGELLQIRNLARIGELSQLFFDNVSTDLTVPNLFWLARAAVQGGLKMENVNFVIMPGNYASAAWSRNNRAYNSFVVPSAAALIELVNESFNPYTQPVTSSMLDLMRVNRDGTIAASSGVLRDTRANPAWLAYLASQQEAAQPEETEAPAETPAAESPSPTEGPPPVEDPQPVESTPPAGSEPPAEQSTTGAGHLPAMPVPVH